MSNLALAVPFAVGAACVYGTSIVVQHRFAARAQLGGIGRRFLERRDAVADVVRIDRVDGGEIGFGRIADDAGGWRIRHGDGAAGRGCGQTVTMRAIAWRVKRRPYSGRRGIQFGGRFFCVSRGNSSKRAK